MSIAFLGFGLIGGSIARALRAADGAQPELVAWSPTGDGPRLALADDVLDSVAASPAEALDGAELVVLAGPPIECLALLDELAGPLRGSLRPGATITDVASTKRAIVARADSHGLRFVGGHPMAGREVTGYAASTAELFQDRPWVVVPGAAATDEDLQRVERLATACGAVPIRMEAEAHDHAVAATSHLPLVLSAALVEAMTVGGLDPTLTAGGWQDMTRLARGDVAMGAGILLTNAPAVAARIRDLQQVLEDWLGDIESPRGRDPERVAIRLAALSERLQAARDRLEALDG